jgi:hypothetical protein
MLELYLYTLYLYDKLYGATTEARKSATASDGQ